MLLEELPRLESEDIGPFGPIILLHVRHLPFGGTDYPGVLLDELWHVPE